MPAIVGNWSMCNQPDRDIRPPGHCWASQQWHPAGAKNGPTASRINSVRRRYRMGWFYSSSAEPWTIATEICASASPLMGP
jgi:hypothetical protein